MAQIGEVFENLTGNENIKATKRSGIAEIFNVRSIHRINVPRATAAASGKISTPT